MERRAAKRELAHTIKLNDRESVSSSTETWSEANWEEALQLTKLKPDRYWVDCGELRGYTKLTKCMPVERCVWRGLQQPSSLSGMERYKGDSCCEDYNEAGGISKQSLWIASFQILEIVARGSPAK